MLDGRWRWDPAWTDRALAVACVDLRAGDIRAAREVLGNTRASLDFGRRAHASTLLARAVACEGVVGNWDGRATADPDALLLNACVSVLHALTAYRRRTPGAKDMLLAAQTACIGASKAFPDDPTPWTALLTLRRTGMWPRTLPERIADLADVPGPWDLLEQEAWPRDRANREAGYQLLKCFSARRGGTNAQLARVAGWIASTSPYGHPLRLAPVLAALEFDHRQAPDVRNDVSHRVRQHRLRAMIREIDEGRRPGDPDGLERLRAKFERELESGPRPDSSLSLHGAAAFAADDVYTAWFRDRPVGAEPRVPGGVLLTDASLLAYGLYAANQRANARTVLDHIAPYASPFPWSRGGEPARVLERVHRHCNMATS